MKILFLVQGTQELISNEELAMTDINSRLSGLRDKTEEYRPLANHGAVIVEVRTTSSGSPPEDRLLELLKMEFS